MSAKLPGNTLFSALEIETLTSSGFATGLGFLDFWHIYARGAGLDLVHCIDKISLYSSVPPSYPAAHSACREKEPETTMFKEKKAERSIRSVGMDPAAARQKRAEQMMKLRKQEQLEMNNRRRLDTDESSKPIDFEQEVRILLPDNALCAFHCCLPPCPRWLFCTSDRVYVQLRDLRFHSVLNVVPQPALLNRREIACTRVLNG